LEYLGDCLPGEVENEILKIFKHSKYELMRSVMKDLAIKDVFHYFIMFISEAEIFVQQWLINHTNEMLFGESEDGDDLCLYIRKVHCKMDKSHSIPKVSQICKNMDSFSSKHFLFLFL
jgi:hypothetical protein